jgi:glycosyltransferase involved in cell wall biosynthesis
VIGDALRDVIVVIPVHNEADLLDRCLRALRAAIDGVRASGVRCTTRIVLDACTDDSRAIVEGHGLPLIETRGACVGAARAVGIESAIAELSGVAPHRLWIANTDGDSVVPHAWLTAQVSAAREGADVFVGTVRPDFADLAPRHQRHWHATHTPGVPNGHVHGASLGVRGSVYLAAGGFEPVGEHEDVSLVDKCRRLGAVVVASDDAEVLTSGRIVGRTPGGYAGYLRDQARQLALE